jgi:hypothetical protein
MLVMYEDINNFFADEAGQQRISISKDDSSVINKIDTKPKGLIISDSYNHFAFPIRPKPRIDTHRIDLHEINQRYRELYGQFEHNMLPWHFTVELVEDRYYVFNTRPIDMKFPLTNVELKNRNVIEQDAEVNKFLYENIVDVSECIHIVIVGDSNLDIYTKRTYEAIGKYCISPFIRYFKIPSGVFQRTYFFNMGKKFNKDLLVRFNRK